MNQEIKRLLLIRHGVSTANLDPSEYTKTPDHCIPLANPASDAGCLSAGDKIAALGFEGFAQEQRCVWTSPYVRCRQTALLVMRRALAAATQDVKNDGPMGLQSDAAVRESFLLREQEFGDWDGWSEDEIAARDPSRFQKRQRMTDAQGRFYFRYPGGESRADVVQRVALFVGKLQRSRFSCHFIFLHGVTQRAFRLAWLNHTVDWFEHEPNPGNASVLAIERDPSTRRWTERFL